MARIDKYQSAIGGFRARLGFAPVVGDVDTPFAVGLNASGRVVKGGGNTGILGILCMSQLLALGDVADVMTSGEIVDMTGLVAGTDYFGIPATGLLTATSLNNKAIGHTVEDWRLVVRCAPGPVNAA